MAPEPPWLDDQQQRVWRQWLATGTRLDAALGRQLQRDSGLTHRDYEVLVHLTEAPEGQLRMTELADAMLWERSRVSHQIARMAGRGLVERMECAQDRRGVIVAVTEAGRDLLRDAAPGHVRTVRRLLFDHLTDEDLLALDRLTAAMLARLDAEAGAFPTDGAHTAYPRMS
ncbi:MAG: MarR family transcriptional regulator [Dermatophilaceae bacterium]